MKETKKKKSYSVEGKSEGNRTTIVNIEYIHSPTMSYGLHNFIVLISLLLDITLI